MSVTMTESFKAERGAANDCRLRQFIEAPFKDLSS